MAILKHSVLCLFCSAFVLAAIQLAAQDDAAVTSGSALRTSSWEVAPASATSGSDLRTSSWEVDPADESKELIKQGAESLKKGAVDIASGTVSLVKAEFNDLVDNTEEFSRMSAEKIKSAAKTGFDNIGEYSKKGAEKVMSATMSGIDAVKEGAEGLREGARNFLGKEPEEPEEKDSALDAKASSKDADGTAKPDTP